MDQPALQRLLDELIATWENEVAEFKREGGVWKFVDGRVMGLDPIRRDSEKVGRNDPCPCGSGKKHKKCCGRG